jgi:predicted RND superfamily exporter protein
LTPTPPNPPESSPVHSTRSGLSLRIDVLLVRLARLQARRPGRILALVGLVTAAAIALAVRLEILTGFDSMLPEDRGSVQELHRVAAKTSGVSTLFVVLEANGTDTPPPRAALRKCADALVPELAKLGPPWVGAVENGVHEAKDFLGPRAGLYAEQAKLEKLRDDIQARYEYEVSKATGTDIELDPEDIPPPIEPERWKKEFGIGDDSAERYPDGYYESEDGRSLVVAIRSKVASTDIELGTEALRRVREVVERVDPKSFAPGITYGFAGDLQTGISEYTAINEDLTEVGYFGAALIAGVVFLYYLRFRTLFAMLVTIGVGVAWTFGVTELAIGHLNMATGFLFTIVAGNGINSGIIYMARYLEARRKGAALEDALVVAHRETWIPTLTAAAAASAAYGSLIVTEFLGFRDFGLIGGLGMLLCWLATYLTLPALLALIERYFPLSKESPGLLGRLRRQAEGGTAFGKPFADLIPLAPRAITTVGLALALVGFGALVAYIRSDPMEYDLRNLRNDMSARAEEIRLTTLAEGITGYVGADGMAILVDSPEQVAPLRTALQARRDAAPKGEEPFKKLHALQDFVPEGQVDKIPILLDIKKRVLRARKRKVIEDADWARLEKYLPPDDLRPFALADLPDGVARAFTETDGTRGRIVYISPTSDALVDDANYLFRWADSYRETKLPDGSVVKGSGRAVIYADMWSAIISDVPPAVSVSFLATVAVVLAAFRRGRSSAFVVGALLVGIAWTGGLLAAAQVRLNFLNFIALPLTFGIGVDYAVNVMQRYVQEGAGGALTAVRETGGAVILCSLTTMFGYLALLRSTNYAVRSMGMAAVVGEVACLAAAILVLPAALVWLDQRRKVG